MSNDDLISLEQTTKPSPLRTSYERARTVGCDGNDDTMLQTLMDTVASGIIIVLKNGKIHYANSAMEQFIGYSRDEITALGPDEWTDMLDPVSRKLVLSTSADTLASTGETPRFEVCFQTRDGTTRWGSMTMGTFEYKGDLAVLATIFDITERRQIEIALRDNEEKFRALSQMVSLAIVIIQDWRILYVNPAGEKMMGHGHMELARMSREEWTSNFDPASCQFIRSLDTDQLAMAGELPGREVGFRMADGTMRWGAMTMGILEYGGNLALLATIFDITDRKQAEETMCTKNRELAILNAIASGINNANDVYDMLSLVLNSVLNLLELDAGAIYLTDGEGSGEMRLASFVTGTARSKNLRCKPAIPNEMPSEAKVYYCNASPWSPDVFEGVMTSLAVPLLIKDKLVGMMALYSSQGLGGKADKSRELLNIGSQLGMAIENHNLFLKIQDTSKYLSDIINESPDAMLIVDTDGRIRSFNKSASRLFKYPANEVIGKKLPSLLAKGEVDLATTKSYVQDFVTKDGIVVQLSVSVSRMNDSDAGSDYIVTLKDLSEISGLKITPIYEKAVDTDPLYAIASGTIYLADRQDGERYLEVFADQVMHNVHGLCVTRQSPVRIRKHYGLEKTPMIWLSGIDAVEGEICMKPDNLSGLGATLYKFLSAADNGFILIDGIEYLIARTNFDTVLKFIHFLNDRVMMSKCSVLIVVDALSIEERQYHMLTSELKPFFKETSSDQPDT